MRVNAIAVAMALAPFVKGQAPDRAVPVEPIAAIVDALRGHRVVALGEGSHGNEQGHAFRLSLIRDPRFAAVVNDIVVEFGSARHQDLMDRFVRGDDIPETALRPVWRDTTQPDAIWDVPIYEEFFREVRKVNESLAPERRLRVLLGDPPIDWAGIHTLEDLNRWMYRDAHVLDVIRRDVLAKNRRALMIYGDQHLVRLKESIADAFTIHTETRLDLKTLQPDAASWPQPSLATVRGTPFEAAADRFDALLYLGPPSAITIAQIPRALCLDRGYMEMRLRRMALVPPPPGAPFKPVERLKEYCALPEGNTEIADREPGITELFRETLRDAAIGKVDPARIAPESRDRLVQYLKDNGPRFLGQAGALESLTLLLDTNEGGKRIRRYRAAFAGGQKILFTVGLSSTGAILSLDPRRE